LGCGVAEARCGARPRRVRREFHFQRSNATVGQAGRRAVIISSLEGLLHVGIS
jgi:hypothetical protein